MIVEKKIIRGKNSKMDQIMEEANRIMKII